MESNKRKRKDADSKGKNHKHRRDDAEPSSKQTWGLGKTHIPTEEELIHNLHNIDYEQELFVDHDENQSASGSNARDPSDGARTPPLPSELDKGRDRVDDLPFYEGVGNPTGFAHCEIWIDKSIRLLPVSPTNEGCFEEVFVNHPPVP